MREHSFSLCLSSHFLMRPTILITLHAFPQCHFCSSVPLCLCRSLDEDLHFDLYCANRSNTPSFFRRSFLSYAAAPTLSPLTKIMPPTVRHTFPL